MPLPSEKVDSDISYDVYRDILRKVNYGLCIIQVIFKGDKPIDYVFRMTNPGFTRYSGLRSVVGRSFREVIPGYSQEWLDRYGHVALTGESASFETNVGSLRGWFMVDAVRVGKPEQRFVAILFLDITGRKRVERELAESEARFSALAEGLPMPVWVLDSKGVIRFINSAYGEFFGLDLSGAVPSWSELLHSEDISVFQFELTAALEQRRALRALVRARRYDGQWRWLEMSARPRYSADGRFIGLAGSSPDVTERREIELAREQLLESERSARNEAESMARLKDEFLATLSHELRTPLTTILGWSELLLQRITENDPKYKGLSVIASSAKAQKRLISDMLDLSSMLLGKIRLDVEPLDLCEQMREAIGCQEPIVQSKHQVMQLHLAQDAKPMFVRGDATRIQQVFWNILSNAVKFTGEGGHIDISIHPVGEMYEVQVSDNGDGIDPHFLPHLFGRFRQADGTTTRRHGGLGLGLAIVQQLVEMHGGKVTATSAGRGKGSTFKVQLPRDTLTARARKSGLSIPPAHDPVVQAQPLKHVHLLVVEDQTDMLEYLRRLLEEQGAEITAVNTAMDALVLLAEGKHTRFHVLLTDIGMPGMDGYGLVRTIRDDIGLSPSDLPVIAVTALARPDDRQRALASGFQEHLAKPYNLAQLIAAVRSVYPY